jgi:hypothetical protein
MDANDILVWFGVVMGCWAYIYTSWLRGRIDAHLDMLVDQANTIMLLTKRLDLMQEKVQ